MSEQDQADYAEHEAMAEVSRAALLRIVERQALVIDPTHLDVMRASLDTAEASRLAALADVVAVAAMVHRQDLADGYV